MLRKSELPAPAPVAEERVTVPELGGEVLVRGLLLRDRISLSLIDGYERMAAMLAQSVFVQDDAGKPTPLYNAEQWEHWGARHYASALNLWDVSRRLSDLNGETATKNLTAPSTGSPAG